MQACFSLNIQKFILLKLPHNYKSLSWKKFKYVANYKKKLKTMISLNLKCILHIWSLLLQPKETRQ